ncbi:hypothetical protein ACSMXN_19075 [Jatrophihabitans sp. DSM 45814]
MAHERGPLALVSDGSEVFEDPRGEGRALRVTHHVEDGFVVLSVWREDRCVSTARVYSEDVPALVHALVTALSAAGPGDQLPSRIAG